jgi:hypothetical protein
MGHNKSIELNMITKPKIYTREYVLEEVKDLLSKLVSHSDYVFKGELIDDKPYSRQRLSEWAKLFSTDEEISDTIQKVDEILETRAISGGLRNKLSANMVKFHLMNNYNWKDKTSLEQTTESQIQHIIVLDG